jgi:MFS family permease
MSLGKSFDRLFQSTLASHISDGLLAASGPLLAATLTRDPILIAGIAALNMLPWLLFGIPIGGLLDRINRRQAMAASAVIKLGSAAAISLAIATGTMNIWVLYIAIFLIGIADVVADTAMQSMLPQLLKPEQIETANSRFNIAQTILGNFIGTPVGGLLYAVAIWIPFAANSLGYAIAAALLVVIPLKVRADWDSAMISKEKTITKFSEDVKFGIKFLLSHKVMLRLVITTAIISLCFSASSATFILFLLDVLKMPEEWFGFILAIEGIAAILGSLHAPWLSKKFGRSRVLAWALIGSCLATGLIAFVPNLGSLIPLMLAFQYLIAVWNILLMSTYHELIPNHLFGRIHGTRRTLVWGILPIGALIGGAVASVDLRAPFLITLTLGLGLAVISWKFINRLPQKQHLTEDDGASAV